MGQGGGYIDYFVVQGAFEVGAVECLARDAVCFAAVERIAGQRVAEVCHVNSDLMSAAGLQAQREQGVILILCQNLEMSDGILTGRIDLAHNG